MRKTFTTAQLTAFLSRPALLALEGVARQLGVKLPPEPEARREERSEPSVAVDGAANASPAGAPRGIDGRTQGAPEVARAEARPVMASTPAPGAEARAPFVETPGASLVQARAPGSPSASPDGANAPTSEGPRAQRTASMPASPGASGPRTVRVVRPASPGGDANPLPPVAPLAAVSTALPSEGSASAPARDAGAAASSPTSDRRVIRLLPSKPASPPSMPEHPEATRDATSAVPPRTDAHSGTPAVAAPRRRLTFSPEGGSTTDAAPGPGSPPQATTGLGAPLEVTASPGRAAPAVGASTAEGTPSVGLTQPALRASTPVTAASARSVPPPSHATPPSFDLPRRESSAPTVERAHLEPRTGAPAFAPGSSDTPSLDVSRPEPRASAPSEIAPGVERATPRPQAPLGHFTEKVSAGLTPVWEQAQGATHAALPVERVTTSSAQGAAVRNTFNVNVHLDASEAPAGMDRRSLEDALVDILRETARRHGLEV
ncbi:hypothetical protein [Corallococcus sp. Z5C101001]|uniref:hypothetical protein n=1 Tax=Corallococcus sp. Z5C101001 TaxID=2596829 RepID=UPI0011804A1A|nr:hypothetical protein [Corallococcus sp. Z5C101001]TSC34244.1 hypothetical protein FOF48_04200 [Corallococcus sp. Z5C101001]